MAAEVSSWLAWRPWYLDDVVKACPQDRRDGMRNFIQSASAETLRTRLRWPSLSAAKPAHGK
jgi:hypothetical protein